MTQFFFPFTSIGGDRQYNAKDFATYFHSIFTDGVIATVKDKLRVSQTEQVGMQVVVNTGAAFIHGHLYLLSEPIILNVTPGSSTSDRVDSIVLQLDHLERNMKILYKQGTTSVRRDENYWELQLATIDVPRNATQVWNRQINDTRADKSVGGYSKLQGELDVEGMEQHYESLLQQLTQDMATWSADKQAQLQDDWDTWFATLQGALEGDVATNLLNMITQLQSSFNAHQEDGTAHGIGDRANLETNEKGTIVGAMNELFTNVSDGKSLVGGAITDVDDSVVIPTEPTFEDLASAIGGISTGKKWASGTMTYTPVRVNEGSSRPLVISDLDFIPSMISIRITGTYYYDVWGGGGTSRVDVNSSVVSLENSIYTTGVSEDEGILRHSAGGFTFLYDNVSRPPNNSSNTRGSINVEWNAYE